MSIIVENLTHIYSPESPFEKAALNDVSLTIKSGEFVGLIGHTGSGKSTLIQHLNGLLKPDSGKIFIDGEDITQKDYNLSKIRGKVGLVFQYPEYQLFEETVYKDIAYGPTNLGMTQEEIDKKIHEVIKTVGLNESILQKSPFEISGGQKRRVAIAGVLAMSPKILILDEPTAGLDPVGRDEILSRIKDIHQKDKITVILVSHSMEDIARIAERVIVMANGSVKRTGTVSEIFSNPGFLTEIGLNIPQISMVVNNLRKNGIDLGPNIYTVEYAANAIIEYLKGAGKC